MAKTYDDQLKEYENLCANLPDAILIITKDGRLLMISRKMEEMSGYAKGDWLGKNVFDVPFVLEKEKALLKTNLQKRFLGESIAPYSIEVSPKNKEKMFVEINGRLIKYGGEEAVLLLMRDITQRKIAEEKLKEVYIELERVNKHLIGRELKMLELKKEIQRLKDSKA